MYDARCTMPDADGHGHGHGKPRGSPRNNETDTNKQEKHKTQRTNQTNKHARAKRKRKCKRHGKLCASSDLYRIAERRLSIFFAETASLVHLARIRLESWTLEGNARALCCFRSNTLVDSLVDSHCYTGFVAKPSPPGSSRGTGGLFDFPSSPAPFALVLP